MNSKDQIVTKLKIDRFEGTRAILFLDGNESILEKKLLPKQAKEGDEIILSALMEETYLDLKQIQAKEILNEILKINKS